MIKRSNSNLESSHLNSGNNICSKFIKKNNRIHSDIRSCTNYLGIRKFIYWNLLIVFILLNVMHTRRSNIIILEIITYLFIVLFVYAAFSKLMDYDHFRIELGKSPLLAGISSYISWVIPVIELGIAISLALRRFQIVGLYMSFTLMTMFTMYLIAVLHFSQFVPCTCGGLIEKMTWNQHIIFNIIFMMLAFTAVLIYPCISDRHLKYSSILG